MSDNGRDSCPYAQYGCTYKNENCRVLMAHEDQCPYNLKINDQSSTLDLYDTIVKPLNQIKQDAPTTDRSDLPGIQKQNEYLLYQQPQYQTAYSPVQQAPNQTRAAAPTYQQYLNQQLSYMPSQTNSQDLPTQTSSTIPTNQQPQIQQHSYLSALPTVQQGPIQTKVAASSLQQLSYQTEYPPMQQAPILTTVATSTYHQHPIQQPSYPAAYSPMQQPPIQAKAAASTYHQHQIQQPQYLAAFSTVQEAPIQTYAAIQSYQQHSHARPYLSVQQVPVQTSEVIPNYQQNQIQQLQYPNSYLPFQQAQVDSSATILSNHQPQMQKPGPYYQNIQSHSLQNAVQAQQASAQPIFDFLQQPGQPIFDIPIQQQATNPIQVLPLNTQIQNQAHPPAAQVQEVHPFENEPIQKQGGFQRSLIVREFATVNKHGHLNCFLNVCLQALWQFQWVRQHLLQLCQERDIGGAQELKPFIESLKKFYQGVFKNNSRFDCSLHEYEGLEVRKELFKLFYDKGEFALHGKADASEALDQILGVIHGWLATKQLREKDTLNMFQCSKQNCSQNCFVHQGFFQQQVEVANCSCGKQSEPLYLDSNLFATTVNTLDLLQTLKNVQAATDTELAKLLASHEVFMDALKWKMSLKKPNCTDPSTNNSDGRHNSSQETWLMNSPEVITLNLQWDGLPSAKDILSILISVPGSFETIKLFNIAQLNVSKKYIFKGMICFQAAHYLCFFRRAPIKFSYVVTQQESNWEQQWKKMWYEATSEEAEWTLYDDAEIVSKGGWAAVIEQCVEFSCYPTVLFFEKLDSEDVDYLNQYQSSHKLSEKQISKLFDLAQDAQGFNDFGSGFSQDEILAQIQLENQFNKNKAAQKTEEVEKKPELDQATLKMLRTKYKEHGIFLFPCNQCSDGIQALHIKKCIKPECQGINYFLQTTPPPDKIKWRECLVEIVAKMKWVSKQNQLVKQPEPKQITEPIKSDQNDSKKVETQKNPEKAIDLPVETVQEQKLVEIKSATIKKVVEVEEIKHVEVQDQTNDHYKQDKEPIQNHKDLGGQNDCNNTMYLQIGSSNHMQDPFMMSAVIQECQRQQNPQSFSGQQQDQTMPPEQFIKQEPQKNQIGEETKVNNIKPENQEQIQAKKVYVPNKDEVNEDKQLQVDKKTQDLIDQIQKEQDEEVVEEKITVWKCPDCDRMMALDEKCEGCKKPADQYTVEIEFQELTKQAYEAARKNVELVKIEEQEEIVTMWFCPMCKIFMIPEQDVCIKCNKQVQYFENTLKISLDTIFVQVKLSEYYDILKKQKNLKEKKLLSQTYWLCPKGCSNQKIKFSNKCKGCFEDFMYYCIEKRMRIQEDLLGSDDQPELWTCKKCNNNNIDVSNVCRKCSGNKYNQEKHQKEDFKEKLKIWHWKCYKCNYTNKYLKHDKCFGCKMFTQQQSVSFEVDQEDRPNVKVEPPKQIEIAKPYYQQKELNPQLAEVAKPISKKEVFKWRCICGQSNVNNIQPGFNICISCKKDQFKDQQQKQEEHAKYPENTWMCNFCRELNFNEDWLKLNTAYCQTCKKFSEERKQKILIALNKQYFQRECEKCKQNDFIKFDQNFCDDCLKNENGEVFNNADEEAGINRVYSTDKNQSGDKKMCKICCGKLKDKGKEGFCFLCLQQKDVKDKEQHNREVLFDCDRCKRRKRKQLQQMCDDCTLQSEPNRCKKCDVECYNKLEYCNECNIETLAYYKNNPYPQAQRNKTKPKEEGIVGKIFGSLFSKDEKKAKVEPGGHQNDKADLFCRDCRKVVKFTRVKGGNKMWIDKEGHVTQTTFM